VKNKRLKEVPLVVSESIERIMIEDNGDASLENLEKLKEFEMKNLEFLHISKTKL
jgi:hypothetical protein